MTWTMTAASTQTATTVAAAEMSQSTIRCGRRVLCVAAKDGYYMKLAASIYVLLFSGMVLHGAISTTPESDREAGIRAALILLASANLLFAFLLLFGDR